MNCNFTRRAEHVASFNGYVPSRASKIPTVSAQYVMKLLQRDTYGPGVEAEMQARLTSASACRPARSYTR